MEQTWEAVWEEDGVDLLWDGGGGPGGSLLGPGRVR